MADADRRMPPDARDETTQARQGKTLGSMRWVLLVSLIAVVVALVVAFWVMPLP